MNYLINNKIVKIQIIGEFVYFNDYPIYIIAIENIFEMIKKEQKVFIVGLNHYGFDIFIKEKILKPEDNYYLVKGVNYFVIEDIINELLVK